VTALAIPLLASGLGLVLLIVVIIVVAALVLRVL
jgi:hypothetical protein